MTWLNTAIFISLFLAVYSYLIYPCILLIISLSHKKIVKRGDGIPSVSFLISAYNEEADIRSKIINTLKLDYPEELLEIIIVSDCSTDNTDLIIQEYPRIKLIRLLERKGKENALKAAINQASGEILVFSDVGTILDTFSLKMIVRNFADDKVGVVSSKDKVLTDVNKSGGEGIYVRYEMFLRELESNVSGLICVSGSLFAARKNLCNGWADDLASDFNIVLNAIHCGYRAILDKEVIGYYRNLKNERLEFPRKVRTVIAGITVFFRTLSLLNVFRYKIYSWQIFSHKLMRWMVPFYLILSIVFCTAGFFSKDYLSTILLYCHLIFFTTGFVGYSNLKFSNLLLIRIPFYFMEVNTAIMVAWINYVTGKRIKLWEPSKR